MATPTLQAGAYSLAGGHDSMEGVTRNRPSSSQSPGARSARADVYNEASTSQRKRASASGRLAFRALVLRDEAKARGDAKSFIASATDIGRALVILMPLSTGSPEAAWARGPRNLCDQIAKMDPGMKDLA